ncbi:MAG TPA: SCP2 sterol-binding domain-containing protein [Aggregatilineales bacterium]|nr:SCP2 sterol-binding domain-containing protein [Chloroflexota bacterium]HQA69093.1 SCP2 sterol-binding domain-containing protein [Aggregatilineales bacterium]
MADSVQELFTELPKRFDPEAWGSQDATLAFKVTGAQGGEWVADIRNRELEVREGTAEDANMTLIAEDKDLLAMINGELNPVTAFMQGKVKIQGDMSLAMKLQNLLSEMR